MIQLKDVTTEFVMCDDYVEETQELIADWESLSEDERKGWYTANGERKKADAKKVLDSLFYELEDDGYDEMRTLLWESTTEEQVAKLQALLDEILDTTAADVYTKGEKIDSDSEV